MIDHIVHKLSIMPLPKVKLDVSVKLLSNFRLKHLMPYKYYFPQEEQTE